MSVALEHREDIRREGRRGREEEGEIGGREEDSISGRGRGQICFYVVKLDSLTHTEIHTPSARYPSSCPMHVGIKGTTE